MSLGLHLFPLEHALDTPFTHNRRRMASGHYFFDLMRDKNDRHSLANQLLQRLEQLVELVLHQVGSRLVQNHPSLHLKSNVLESLHFSESFVHPGHLYDIFAVYLLSSFGRAFSGP